MSVDDDVTAWIDGLRRRDTVATQHLWERYYQRLVNLAAQRLPPNLRREFDEEDVALSAIDSFCRGAAKGRFPDLADRNSLWALLIVITRRKCRAKLRHHAAQKRGGGDVQGESAFDSGIGGGISVAESCVGEGKSPQIGEGVAEILGAGLLRAPAEEGVSGLGVTGGSVIAGTGVALLSALTVATTLVSSGPFDKGS